MSETSFRSGDVVVVSGVRYTLIERHFAKPGQAPLWLAVESRNPKYEPRFLEESRLPKPEEPRPKP